MKEIAEFFIMGCLLTVLIWLYALLSKLIIILM